MSRWTYEIEYQSAEKKATTGQAILRNQLGVYAGKVHLEFAPFIVNAANFYLDELTHAGEPI